jgi:LCP family protein required for cell wall assembly
MIYGVCCVAAASTLTVSYFAHADVGDVTSIGTSHAITSGPSIGAQNILIMGLESRTNYDGQILPANLLAAMHAGSVQDVENGTGGQDTNTLILIHVFAGGQRAVGYSIPRDDWVTFPQAYDGQSEGKIDQAYGLAWAQSLSSTSNSKMGTDQRYFLANEAGQAASVATVTALTGVHIDHFLVINLEGYYELAKAFDGIEVCLKSWNHGQNLHDTNSGFDAHHAGYLHLGAGQALAFVRERDNLPNGDIDRTYRQQAVIDYVVWDLKHNNVLSDFSRIQSLLSEAKQYVISDAGWNLLDFGSEMQGLTGKNLKLATAPITGYATYYPGGEAEDANTIDPAAIKKLVLATFYPPATAKKAAGSKPKSTKPAAPASPSASTVSVLNGGYTSGLAAQVSTALSAIGYKAGQVGNATSQSTTTVLYGAGASNAANAANIASAFGVTATASSSVAAGQVQVVLGSDATTVPSFTSSSSTSSSSSSPSSTSPDVGTSGGTGSVSNNAPYGIPCVY